MPPLKPLKRIELIGYLKKSGFDGPYSGGKHQFMVKGKTTIRIPNPHKKDISKALITRLLKQAGISLDDWEKL